MEKNFVNTGAHTALTWLTFLCVIGLIAGALYAPSLIDNKVNTAVENIEIPAAPTAAEIASEISLESLDNELIQKIYDEMDESVELTAENIAEELALSELDSRDFKEYLMTDIQNEIDNLMVGDENEQEGLTIEKYKDINDATSIDVEDVTVRKIHKDEGNGNVEVEFKVTYILDDDEDLVGKARIVVIYFIDDLVEDDDFEDAVLDRCYSLDSVYLYKELV